MQIEIDDVEIDKFIDDVMECEPEYSSSVLVCTHYDYAKCYFVFHDEETGEFHPVNRSALKFGLKKLLVDIMQGKIKLDLNAELLDAGNWDSTAVDALVQYAIFDEVIYG
jgi:hypothetical protein